MALLCLGFADVGLRLTSGQVCALLTALDNIRSIATCTACVLSFGLPIFSLSVISELDLFRVYRGKNLVEVATGLPKIQVILFWWFGVLVTASFQMVVKES